jgi:hypothetical protein
MDFVPNLFDEPEVVHPEPETASTVSRWLTGGLLAGVAIAVGVIAYYGIGPMLAAPSLTKYSTNSPDVAEVLGMQGAVDTPALSNAIDESTQKALVERLAMLQPELPEEEVTLFYVTDAARLQNNAFFAEAMKDDVLFVYQQSGVAILYRPVDHRIIHSGTVSSNQ